MKTLRSLTALLMLLTSRLLISNTTPAKTILKLSHNQDKSHIVHKALSYLADKTKEYSNGELVIRTCLNATSGNERESLELTNSGALQMVKVNAVSLELFTLDYGLSGLSFLFRGRDHYYRVLQSDLGKKIFNSSESKGFVGITYHDGGAESFYSNKSITKPEDSAGMKTRVQQSLSAIAIIKALGGAATPMAQGELYIVFQQGVVDGGENNTAVYADMRYAEVVKVYLRDEYIMIPDMLITSTNALNRPGDKERIALLKAADESTMQMKDVIWSAAKKEVHDKIKGMNATVVDVDKSAFKERVKPLYDGFKAKGVQSIKNLELIESMQL